MKGGIEYNFDKKATDMAGRPMDPNEGQGLRREDTLTAPYQWMSSGYPNREDALKNLKQEKLERRLKKLKKWLDQKNKES